MIKPNFFTILCVVFGFAMIFAAALGDLPPILGSLMKCILVLSFLKSIAHQVFSYALSREKGRPKNLENDLEELKKQSEIIAQGTQTLQQGLTFILQKIAQPAPTPRQNP